MKPGIYHDISGDDYHSRAGYSASFFKQCFKENLAKAKFNRIELTADTEEIGHGVHADVLEPDKELLVRGPDRRGTNDWKAAKEDAEWNGKILVKGQVYDQIKQMSASLKHHSRCGEILAWDDKVCEASIWHELDGLLVKIRPDLFSAKRRAIADVKTCQSSDPYEFQKTSWQLGYPIQAAFYVKIANEFGIPIDDFYFLTVEKKFPYLAHCHKLSRAALNYGLDVVDRMLPLIKEAHESDTWLTGWPDETELDLPSWVQESA